MIYNIWTEGFRMTGNSCTAELAGSVEADTFQEACDKLFEGDELYDPKHLSYWGMRLYDNEADARKNFG